MQNTQTEELLLVKAPEAARLLSLGKSTLWDNVKNGKIPAPIKIGRATRWRVADLKKYVAGLEPENV